MDGLLAMRRAVETAKRENVKPMKKMVGPYAGLLTNVRSTSAKTVSIRYLIMVALLSFSMGLAAAFFAPVRLKSLLI